MTSVATSQRREISDGVLLLEQTVLAGGFCIGCGGCAHGSDAAFEIAEVKYGRLGAVRRRNIPSLPGDPIQICPFSGEAPDETELASEHFGDLGEPDANIGILHYAGALAICREDDRERGSSGGGVTWILRRLLETGVIDRAAHVKPVDPASDPQGRLFRYDFSATAEELEVGRKSHYYPVDLADVFDRIGSEPGRYAIVALPCFAKAIRLAARRNPLIAERVVFVVGIVCGHLKSRHFAEYLGWSVGIAPVDLVAMDFRRKMPEGDAGCYGYVASSRDHTISSMPMNYYFATAWEIGLMKYPACDCCDDVFAETADVVFGDAWIPPFDRDWRGHNIVVSRRPEITALLEAGEASGAIELVQLQLDQIRASQMGGIRHRHEGLAFRLALLDQTGRWRPRKRIAASNENIDTIRADIYRARIRLRESSARAFAVARRCGLLMVFHLMMTGPVFEYYCRRSGLQAAIRQTFPMKLLKRLSRV